MQNIKRDSLLKETSDIMLTKGKGGKGKIRGWEAIDNIRKGGKGWVTKNQRARYTGRYARGY